MHKLNINRFLLSCLVILAFVSFSVISRGFAQAPPTGQNPPAASDTKLGPDVELFSTSYLEPKNDPFFDESLIPKKAPEPKVVKNAPAPVEIVPPPGFEDRDASWKEKRERSRTTGQPEPAASEKYLIDEVKILGIYKKPDGQGVFLKPTATASTMIFATIGQEFWNGKITRIEKDKVEFEVRTLYSDKSVKTRTEFRPFLRK